jgi:hypothetical protein
MQQRDPRTFGRRAAVLTVACLGSSVFFVFPALLAFNTLAPAFSQRVAPWLFFALLGLSCAGGGYLWGWRLTNALDGAGDGRQSAAAALGFGLTAPVAVYSLTIAENLTAYRLPDGRPIPVHLLFAAVFPLAAFTVSGAASFALAMARGGRAAAARTALSVACAALATFAAVDLAFDLARMRIGAPGAERRATMLVVMAVGLLASSLAAGYVLGRALARMPVRGPAPAPAPREAAPAAAIAP